MCIVHSGKSAFESLCVYLVFHKFTNCITLSTVNCNKCAFTISHESMQTARFPCTLYTAHIILFRLFSSAFTCIPPHPFFRSHVSVVQPFCDQISQASRSFVLYILHVDGGADNNRSKDMASAKMKDDSVVAYFSPTKFFSFILFFSLKKNKLKKNMNL